MVRRVLDTNILINHWGEQSHGRHRRNITAQNARDWARRLVEIRATTAILTPIYIEYICGKPSAHDVQLARTYLDEFEIVDAGRILPQDWEHARRLAERVNRDGSPRQLGDCLIRAICNRLHFEVYTADKRFPH